MTKLAPYLFVILLITLLPFATARAVQTPLSLDSAENGGIVQCGNGDSACSFNNVVETVIRLISFMVFKIAVPITIIAIVWAGINMVLAQGNSSKTEAAKNNLWNILKGFAYIALAALIVISIAKLLEIKKDFLPDSVNNNSIRTSP